MKPKRRAARRSPRAKRTTPRPRTPKGYVLQLFVTGASPRSARAIANLKKICKEIGAEVALLEVIDIYQQPELARAAQLVAAPTLLKKQPLPPRRMVGDLSDHARVMSGLGIPSRPR